MPPCAHRLLDVYASSHRRTHLREGLDPVDEAQDHGQRQDDVEDEGDDEVHEEDPVGVVVGGVWV